MKTSIKLIALAFVIACNAQGIPEPLPQDLEIALAKSSLPTYLREEASVYVLKKGEGYVKVIEGSNGYTCFVERPRLKGTLAPISFDSEGTRVMVPPRFEKAKLIQQGVPRDEAQAKINEGFKNGKYLPPSIGGISYMLSPLNILPRGNTGQTFTYHPHFMIYSPYATNEALGSKVDLVGYLPFVNSSGPHGFIIVPVGKAERKEIAEEHKELIARYEEYANSKGL